MPVSERSTRLLTVATGSVLSLLWLLPFCLSDHKVPVGTFWQEWVAAMLLCLGIVLALAQTSGPRTLRIPHVAIALAGLAAVIALQYTLGLLNFAATLTVPLLYLTLALMACTLGNTLRETGDLARLAVWLALACAVGGILNVNVQLAQWLGIENFFPFMSQLPAGQRPFGNINQSNHTATYFGMALASVLYLRSTKRLSWPGTSLAALILVGGLALTGQRSAIVYSLLPLMLTLLGWKTLGEPRTGLLKISLALPLLFVIANLLIESQTQATATPLTSLLAKSLYSERGDFWRHALAMLAQHPLLGVGFDQFWPAYFNQLETLHAHGEAPNNPHNLLAALLAETGLLGTLVILLPLLVWLWRTRLAATTPVEWLAWTQIAAIGFHSLVEYPLWYSYFLIVFAFWLGATDRCSWRVTLPQARLGAAALLLISGAALTNIAISYQQLRNTIWSVPHVSMADIPHFIPPQPKALDPLSGHWFFEREVHFWMPDLMTVSPDHLADKITLTEQAMSVAPTSRALYDLILLKVLNHQPGEAVLLLKRAQQVYPARYEEMLLALPHAAIKWPEAFNEAMPLLLPKPEAADAGTPPAPP
jgi:O-antigen ligase